MLTGWRAEVHRANPRQALAHMMATTLFTWIAVGLAVGIAYLLGYDVAGQWRGYSGLTWIITATLSWNVFWWAARFYVKRFTQPPVTQWHDGLAILLPLLIIAAFAHMLGRR